MDPMASRQTDYFSSHQTSGLRPSPPIDPLLAKGPTILGESSGIDQVCASAHFDTLSIFRRGWWTCLHLMSGTVHNTFRRDAFSPTRVLRVCADCHILITCFISSLYQPNFSPIPQATDRWFGSNTNRLPKEIRSHHKQMILYSNPKFLPLPDLLSANASSDKLHDVMRIAPFVRGMTIEIKMAIQSRWSAVSTAVGVVS
jgi:hypothetical protein